MDIFLQMMLNQYVELWHILFEKWEWSYMDGPYVYNALQRNSNDLGEVLDLYEVEY